VSAVLTSQEAALISALRYRLSDTDLASPVFETARYQAAISSAVRWVNARLRRKFGYTPSVGGEGLHTGIESIPDPFRYYVEIRAAAELALQRATASLGTATQVRERVQVPNLLTEREDRSEPEAAYWRALADAWMEELDSLIEENDNAAGVSSTVVTRKSGYTGTRTNRQVDSPPPAPVLSLSLVGGKVSLAWDNWKSVYFHSYRLQRSQYPDFATSTSMVITDNHRCEICDQPDRGLWYYRVITRNGNGLVAVSNTVSTLVD
jgi:hypothetical protein